MKMHFLAIILHVRVVIVIRNLYVKDQFLIKPSFSESVVNMFKFSAEFIEPQGENRNSTICWISQNQKLSDKF